VFTVAAKDAANESKIIISNILPVNFTYRLTSCELFIQSTSLAVFDDIEKGWTVVVAENQVTQRRFGIFNSSTRYLSVAGIKSNDDSVTNDFGTWYTPGEAIGDQLVNGTGSAAVITVQGMDTTSDATAAFQCVFRMLALAYTFEQYNAAPINTSIWTT